MCDHAIPHLETVNGIRSLIVDGRPFLALGGEIHNSSASSLEYLEEKVWPFLRGLHLNTVICPVYWELCEPRPGEFDFSLLEGLLQQARREGVRLVLLWFGLWKNGESHYVPAWVKQDPATYARARQANGGASDTVSPFCRAAVQADARAFAALMSQVKRWDGDTHTVIAVQVENEIGFLGSARDFSPEAEAAFARRIPECLARPGTRPGSWEEAFGEDACETFMAWHYASAVETIASAGKAIHPIPLYANAWLRQFPARPGIYPSGGPTANMLEVWQKAAPSLDFLAPDIYVPGFREVCAAYARGDNPLFIPEARRDLVSAVNVFHAVGKHHAMGFAPFGIEDFLAPRAGAVDQALLADLNIALDGFTDNGTGPWLAKSYALLQNLWPTLARLRGTHPVTGFVQEHERGELLSMTSCEVRIDYAPAKPGVPRGGGLVLELSPGEFLVAGLGFSASFLPRLHASKRLGILSIEEGIFQSGNWVRRRVLNGDEQRVGLGSEASMVRVRLYHWEGAL